GGGSGLRRVVSEGWISSPRGDPAAWSCECRRSVQVPCSFSLFPRRPICYGYRAPAIEALENSGRSLGKQIQMGGAYESFPDACKGFRQVLAGAMDPLFGSEALCGAGKGLGPIRQTYPGLHDGRSYPYDRMDSG